MPLMASDNTFVIHFAYSSSCLTLVCLLNLLLNSLLISCRYHAKDMHVICVLMLFFV